MVTVDSKLASLSLTRHMNYLAIGSLVVGLTKIGLHSFTTNHMFMDICRGGEISQVVIANSEHCWGCAVVLAGLVMLVLSAIAQLSRTSSGRTARRNMTLA